MSIQDIREVGGVSTVLHDHIQLRFKLATKPLLTATDKRNILACIEFLRRETNPPAWLGRPGSNKRYCLGRCPDSPNRWFVLIRETYRTDHGERREQAARNAVALRLFRCPAHLAAGKGQTAKPGKQ